MSVAKTGDRASLAADVFLLSLIILNVAAVVLESVEAIAQPYAVWFSWFERISVAIFTLEYLARLYSCVEETPQLHPLRSRLRWIFTPLAIVDLLAVLPFYLPFLGIDLRFIRVFRLMRVFRVAKIARYSASVRLIRKVIASRREDLTIAAVLMLILITASSCLMFFAEHDAQPEKFPSVPSTMWWAVATLTTVGYGDVYPITAAGRLLGGLVAILGIGFFALPTAIVGAGFLEELQRKRDRSRACPHCGRKIDQKVDG